LDLDALHVNAYTATLVEVSDDFRAKLLDGYTKDTRWSKVIDLLKTSEQSDDPVKAVLPYFLEKDLLYTTGTNSTERKLCIPRSVVPEIFELAHDSAGHQGFARTYERLAGLAIYKGSRLLKQYIAACPQCNQNSTKRHRPYGSLQPIIPPPIPFHTITIDIVMALPNSKDGKDQALTSTDKFTKRVGIIPGKATWSAEEWGVALVRHWQLTDWGFPRVIISDRDRKFLSNLCKGIFKTLRTKLLYSTAYHTQTDGQSERINATIEIMLLYFLAIIYSTANDSGSESPFIVDD
jgi:hypothetical protein